MLQFTQFALSRAVMAIVTLLLVSFIVFTLMELVPANCAERYLAFKNTQGQQIAVADIKAEEQRLGLDRPYVERWARWVGNVFFRGDFGNSCILRVRINQLLGQKFARSIKTNFRWVTTLNIEKRRYVYFFVKGWDYEVFGVNIDLPGERFGLRIRGIILNRYLFGVDTGGVHIFGTDPAGKDVLSRTLHAVWTSLAVGTIGVMIGFVLALVIGGVSGYWGGKIDGALSFIGLGLKDPVNSLGVMLQNVTSTDVLLNYQWYFIPVLLFIAMVLAFVFVVDGLRHAADPYSDHR